ncbi:MAG: aspartate--tRNA ligase, partial [Acidobacteria bacterium]|nr:aspartate--tRNA ligase [Acidobacteriota bacterium]
MLDFLGDLKRTHLCGALRASDSGRRAVLMGWVNRRRDLGSIIFIDLRDRTGVTQIVFSRDMNPRGHEKAEQLRNEYVIAVTGTVKQRDPETINKNIPTGEVELIVDELRILNESKQPPFLPSEAVLPNEEMRLKYRYIDLRRDSMQFNIEMRHKVTKAIRDYLSGHGFFEIETPFMTRSTPEGARDYLVPSRIQPGCFYALPQSPQMFKQILMISGFEKYFQIVRCFRDEDFRADRQAEFTQIDLEMSYPQTDSVWEVVEGFLTAAFRAAGHEIKTPFPRMSYDQAIRSYGNDKPDLRLPAMIDVREALTPEELNELAGKFKMRKDFPVQLIRIPKAGDISGTERRTIGTYGAFQHVQGPLFVQLITDPKRLAKDYPAFAAKILAFANVEPDDLWLIAGGADRPDNSSVSHQSVQHFSEKCGFLRLDLAQKYASKHKAFEKTGDPGTDFRFLWVSDFPMFEWDKQEKRWNPAHHPFTTLHEEDMAKLDAHIDSVHDPDSPLGDIRALAYDVVLNGTELGSGS